MTTQKSVNIKIKKIIEKGMPFSEQDHDFLIQVVKQHPNKNRKDEIENIILNKNKDGLLIRYSDSTIDSISYKKCVRAMLTGKNSNHENIREALRNEIYVEQVLPFRKQNNMYGKGDEYHVGHGSGNFSFDSIVSQFFNNLSLKEEDIDIEKRKIKDYYESKGYFLADKILSEKWRSFHKQFSNLIMQTAQENLREK